MPKKQTEQPLKPTLFIGSSTEGVSLAEAAQAELSRTAEVIRWDQGAFPAGWNTLESLIKIGQTFDFVMLIATGDDLVRSRRRQTSAVRDNVLFEFGLFIGLLSVDRVFYVYDDDAKPRIPTDLLGQSHLPFKRLKNPFIPGDKNRAAIGPACTSIRQAIEKKGRRFHWLDPGKPITEELPAEVLALKLIEHQNPSYAKELKPGAVKIVMIEDGFMSSMSMARFLYMFDCHVVNCYDGKIGLEQVIASRPNLVIIDRQLPTMNGLDICKNIKNNETTSSTPVIMLSGYSEPEDQIAAFAAGVDDFVGKPVDVRILIERIRKQVDRINNANRAND